MASPVVPSATSVITDPSAGSMTSSRASCSAPRHSPPMNKLRWSGPNSSKALM